MDKNLKNLIAHYQASVRAAVAIMQRSGIPLPATSSDWINTDIPGRGKLEGGIAYFKHGFGCHVNLPTGPVDFDFGERGEIDGFDLWRLVKFAGPALSTYGFATQDEVKECFETAVNSGSLVSSGYILYYVAGAERSLAGDRCDTPNKNDSI